MKNKYECFTGKAEIYAKSWPQFGEQYVRLIKKVANEIGAKKAYDVACGTGLHTKRISSLFDKIYAIEPNADMLNSCRSYLHNCKNVEFYLSTAEDLSCIDTNADIIFVAQAFNLLNHSLVRDSFRRKLNNGGLVILTWNSKTDYQLYNDIAKVSEKYCPEYDKNYYKNIYEKNTFDYFFIRRPMFYKFTNDVPDYIEKEIFLMRCISTSYALTKDHKDFPKYLSELEDIYNQYQSNGKILYPLNTVVYIGEI